MSSFLFETFIKEPTKCSFVEMLELIEPLMLTVENKSLFSTVKCDEKIELSPNDSAVPAFVPSAVPAFVPSAVTNPIVSITNVASLDTTPSPICREEENITITQPWCRKDSLFWCLYILHFGYNDFLQISRNYGVRSLEVKQKISEWLTKQPSALKQTNYKITKASIQEIISDCLTCQKETNMLSILAILVYYKMNVFLIDEQERLLLECIGNVDEAPTYLLKRRTGGQYSILGDALSPQEMAYWKEKCFCLAHYEKPLQTISHYKVDELHAIAKKVNIKLVECKKYKKHDLYVLIWTECLWQK